MKKAITFPAMLEKMYAMYEAGKTLFDAFSEYPDIFNGVYLARREVVIYLHKCHVTQKIDMTHLHLIHLVAESLLEVGDELLATVGGDEGYLLFHDL